MTPTLTREDLIRRYNAHCCAYYRRSDGTPTRHAQNIELATRPIRSQLSADSFGLDELRAYRDALVHRGLKRRTINQWVGWVRGMFRWAACEQLIPASVAAELTLLEPLRYGRSPAKESTKRSVVTLAMVRELLPLLRPTVGRMLCVQWLTGMRPGELVAMRWDQFTTIDGCTVFAPEQHKTAHHNRARVIVLVREVMKIIEHEPRCSPWVWTNARGGPFRTDTYAQVVVRACRRNGIEPWRPGRIRRSSATYARRVTDSETVQRMLGHASLETTEIYFDLDTIDALEAAERLNFAPKWGEYRSDLLKALASGTR